MSELDNIQEFIIDAPLFKITYKGVGHLVSEYTLRNLQVQVRKNVIEPADIEYLGYDDETGKTEWRVNGIRPDGKAIYDFIDVNGRKGFKITWEIVKELL